ncbi:hypothetical protein, partial [Streptomyces prunicolor]
MRPVPWLDGVARFTLAVTAASFGWSSTFPGGFAATAWAGCVGVVVRRVLWLDEPAWFMPSASVATSGW